MKLIVTICIVCLLPFCSCKKNETIPECVNSHIKEFQTFICEHGASVKEYKFQNKIVYVFNMGWCGADLTARIIDNNCNSIGSLGGISGNTQVNGVSFSIAVYIRTIWSN